MCGICGFVTRSKMCMEDLIRMNDSISHRGPDDHGEELYYKAGRTIGFGQRRLSIIDLSKLGHQPMHSFDNRLTVIFNGEIYNYIELRNELTDYLFHSECDTEIIIAAYMRWGVNCFNHFNGMFAIAIYDRMNDTVILARDRVGKKPLYYYIFEDELVFASELKPIMLYPHFKKCLNGAILSRFIVQQYIAAPDTVFQNVYKLYPGSYLIYSNGYNRIEQYWSVNQEYGTKSKCKINNYQDSKEILKHEIEEAVDRRLRADVPVGVFLSGGIDSSLVAAVAQSISNEKIKTFSVGFIEENDEAIYAKEIASYLDTDHTEMYMEKSDLLRYVEEIPRYYDEPFADSSELPMMFLAEFASNKVKVVLSGDGGDEFFLGYPRYRLIRQAQKLDPFGRAIYNVCNIPGIDRFHIDDKLPFKIRMIVQNRNKDAQTQFPTQNYYIIAKKMINADIEQKEIYYNEKAYTTDNWLEKNMLMTITTYLSEDILCKVDRATMKYALEARCPLLDVNVMETAFRIPTGYKLHGGQLKYILKELAYEYIPKALLDRPKCGFGGPIDLWLRGPLREKLLDYSSELRIKEQNIFDYYTIQWILDKYLNCRDKGQGTGENYSKIIWSFFVFQQWYEHYMR